MPDEIFDALLPKQPLEEPDPEMAGDTPEESESEGQERGQEQKQEQKKDSLPPWFRGRLSTITKERDGAYNALAEKGAELSEANRRIEALERRIEGLARQSGPERNTQLRQAENELADLQRLAAEEPEKLPRALASYAQQAAEAVVDKRMEALEAAQTLTNKQMEWLQRGIQMFPEVQEPGSDLARHAEAKWIEEMDKMRQGQLSLAHLEDGRYRCIAEAAAELDIIRRDAQESGPQKRRRQSQKLSATLETGEGREMPAQELTGAQLSARARRGKQDTAENAVDALVGKLIPKGYE